jgi:enediyne biosynthesis protein E4
MISFPPATPWRFHFPALLLPAVVLAGIVALVLVGCSKPLSSSPPNNDEERVAPFRDVADEAGVHFRHVNGMSGKFYMPEIVGAGVALFDYNNDGKLDIFLVQGGPLGPDEKPDPARRPRHRLFRNDTETLPNGERVLKFTDVTDEAGLNFADYGMGVAAADFDGDGFIDLYITCFGRNRLLHNNGNGTFTDVTEKAGVGCAGWSTSAAWIDFDHDGRPDLFVCQYLEWTYNNHQVCRTLSGGKDYCGPISFPPARSRLFHNLGNGRFEDVSLASGIQAKAGAALGVVVADLNEDGWPDIFVANDGMPNFLWINQRDGTFKEEATPSGCALNRDGRTEANMGVALADFTNSGRDDLFITHLTGEKSTYYRNLGKGLFVDETARCGLDAPTRPFTGFGTAALDYDNDGLLDIFSTNGEVRLIDKQVRAGVELPLRQRCQLFHNLGGKQLRFEEIRQGQSLRVEEVGRGVAFGDLNNDGAVDIVVTNNNGPARLLLNQAAQGRHWLGLRLVDGPPGRRRDVLGAVATVERPGQSPLRRRCATDGSYCSSSDPRVLFGLGESTEASRVRVQWPDGLVEQFQELPIDRYHELVRGSGRKSGNP